MTSYPRPKDSWGGVREGTKSFTIKIYLKDSKGGVREGTKFKKFFLPSASRAALDRDNAFGVILSLRFESECLKIDVSERLKSPKLKNIQKCRVYSFLPTAVRLCLEIFLFFLDEFFVKYFLSVFFWYRLMFLTAEELDELEKLGPRLLKNYICCMETKFDSKVITIVKTCFQQPSSYYFKSN